MAKLTEAQQLDFVRRVAGILREAKDEFTDTDFDPEKRATELDTLAGHADKAEAEQLQAQQLFNQKTKVSQEKRKKAYDRASASVEGVVGALDKNHALVRRLKNLRDSMATEALRGRKRTPPA